MEKYIVAILAYMIGSIPFSFIITKINGINLKSIGSGNIGATNVLRTGNKSLALLALLLDVLKGFTAISITQKFSNDCVNLSIVLVILGHMFPIWLRLRGGKGVATTLGVLFALNNTIALIFLFIWIITFFIFRYSSLASLSAIALSIIISFIIEKNLFLIILGIGAIIFIKHYENIKNLLQGREYRFNKLY
ncbi:MAG: glycerol-3-phosphate 1-O-acyltransferase PlsY [Wolbachia endosymbiont of Fragariocoptes setiger]|nr:glycerol-3-phosphate 1-O-acyltransferase PlsY [Wolbachia endosymbiont of Fragariocoptes setiger]